MPHTQNDIKSVTLKKIAEPTGKCNYDVTITYHDGHIKKRKMTSAHIKDHYFGFLTAKEQKEINPPSPIYSRSGHFLFADHERRSAHSTEEDCCRPTCVIL